MGKRLITTTIAAVAAASAVLVPAAPALAAPAIQINRVYFDSPGADRGSNSSLNAEWVQLKNTARTGRQLRGWKLRDNAGFTYTFGPLWLRAGTTVTVHTGKGTNGPAHRYWGRSWYVWNNTGDKATLRRADGSFVDACEWGSSGESKWC